jgi:hypothetical protein
MKKKRIPHCQNSSKINRKIAETEAKSIPITSKNRTHSLSWFATIKMWRC